MRVLDIGLEILCDVIGLQLGPCHADVVHFVLRQQAAMNYLRTQPEHFSYRRRRGRDIRSCGWRDGLNQRQHVRGYFLRLRSGGGVCRSCGSHIRHRSRCSARHVHAAQRPEKGGKCAQANHQCERHPGCDEQPHVGRSGLLFGWRFKVRFLHLVSNTRQLSAICAYHHAGGVPAGGAHHCMLAASVTHAGQLPSGRMMA